MTDCPHMTGTASCTVCQQVAAVEELLALAAKVSPSPNMTVEVRHVRYALDKRRVPDLLAGKKVGRAATGPAA